MITTFLIKQHCKCTKLLELIDQCDERIVGHKEGVAFYRSEVPKPDLAEFHLYRWQTTLAVKERLVNSYSAALAKLVKPVIDKVMA